MSYTNGRWRTASKVPDYCLKRWKALTRYLDEGAVPIDTNPVENQIKPLFWAFPTRRYAGFIVQWQRPAAIMNLIQSAKLNGHNLYVYLKGMLSRRLEHKNRAIVKLLSHS